jgi:hypothetical protein
LAGGQGPAVLAGGQGPAVLAGGQSPAVLAGGLQGAAVHVAMVRPEVASGAHAVLLGDPAEAQYEADIALASAWGGPAFAAEPEFAAEPGFAAERGFTAEDYFPAEDEFAAQDEFTDDDEFAEEDFAAEAAADPDVVQLRPRHQGAAYYAEDADEGADEDADEDPAAEDRPEHSPSGTARRNRITRGYSIPRLSRAKRPGAIPGL